MGVAATGGVVVAAVSGEAAGVGPTDERMLTFAADGR